MIIKIRNSRWAKVFSTIMGFQLFIFSILPQNVMALTGGPSQPEFSSFTPVGTSDMVDLFTGDFQYNIPLIDVGGYPINLSYASGISMEQQASNVGLGWRINAGGEINRTMRGIPDDFNESDIIIKRNNIKRNLTAGANISFTPEVVGNDAVGKVLKVGLSFGAFYNTYKGIGYTFSVNPSISIADGDKSDLNLGLGLTANSQSGVSINPSLSLESKFSGQAHGETVGMASSIGFGASVSSRAGLKAIAFDASIKSDTKEVNKDKEGNKTLVKDGLLGKGSFGVSTSIPVGMSTYIPNVSNAMSSSSFSADFGTGLELFWANAKVKIGGYYNEQHLRDKIVTYPAAGYLYSERASINSMHDFNREKDGAVNVNTPHIAMAQATYDVYNVSGQGVGGMYRPHRDVGVVYDPYVNSTSNGGSIGGDLGGAQLIKGGLNISYNYNSSNSGRWSSGRPDSRLNYKKKETTTNKPDKYESFYFKNAGEFSIIDEQYLKDIGGLDPIRVDVNDKGIAMPYFKRRASLSSSSESIHPINDLKRKERAKRNQSMSMLTAAQASVVGVDNKTTMTSHTSYTSTNNEPPEPPILISKVSSERKSHHISELTINRNDGARYVYGIQQYNYKQIEASFNVENTPNCTNGYIEYVPNEDNTVNNKKGIDHFFSSTELPAYATAYMLTSVLSSDYVDVSGDGLTDDDLGNYTKFNYTRTHGGSNPYKWRNPYPENQANFSEGYKSIKNDNKGNYVYGEKEIWVTHSIETKQYIAEFYYSDRLDAYDVSDENGGQGNNTLQKLDSIKLYTKCERQDPVKGPNALPLKVVHFEYDYSLCLNIPSNINYVEGAYPAPANSGKLTLKKVYFTYQGSGKGKLSPYIFKYPSNNNYDYDFRGNDRWGNYKKNLAVSCNIVSNPLSTTDDPYVEQDKLVADLNTSAWHLNEIQLPSGGVIKVDYESDDYAYVQDKRATQMFKVLGFADNSTPSNGLSSRLYAKGTPSHGNNEYIFFSVDAETNAANFRSKYIGEGQDQIKELFYKFLIDVTGKGDYEYVSGYASAKEYGFYQGMGWIKLKSVDIADNGIGAKIHPISKTAMQYVRLNMPEKIFGGEDKQLNPVLGVFSMITGAIKDVTSMLVGPNRYLAGLGYGKNVVTGKSFIRLQTPNYAKLGGGSRVKKVAINDNWKTMSGNGVEDFDYGQTYEYTTIENGIKMSSGVAAYEPFIGNEENPCRQPVAYTEAAKIAPDNSFYQETPYGESFYPSPTVGYSKVKVTNLVRKDMNGAVVVKRTATGYVQHEFYTAKDFPVIVKKPYTLPLAEKSGLLGNLFKVNVKDNLSISQSHVIELNDMHGKQKAQWVYAEDQETPISGVEYFYKTQEQNSKQLSNSLTVITKEGNVIEEKQGGINVDMVTDERESKQFSFGMFIPGNIDVSIIPVPFLPVPLPIPSAWPKVTRETTRYRSLSNTKVITRYGILEKTVAHDLGSTVSTENIAWDAETGDVLLTETKNGFEDPVYSFTYPAHWGYDRMGPSYKNIGLQVLVSSLSSGTFNIVQGNEKFIVGDEVMAAGNKYWVVGVTANSITLQDKNGVFPSNSNIFPGSIIQVIRSGRRNQQSIPIGTVTTLTNPVQGGKLKFENVLNAGAVEFKEEWGNFCECSDLLASTNPYVIGEKGNYRAQKSHLFLAERLQSTKNRNTNIRKDGVFENFEPFCKPNSIPGKDWLAHPYQWTFTSEVTLFSPYGFELENRDALGRYSAADYGYNNTLPKAVASNAQYKEIGFDNFEDYDCDNCTDDHFSFKENAANVVDTEAHSGRRSIKVGAGGSIKLEKVIAPCQLDD